MAQGLGRLIARPERRTLFYVGALVATAATTGVVLMLAGYEVEEPVTVLVLAAAAAVAERNSVRLTKSTELTIAGLPTLFAAVLLGPLAAGVVGSASMLGDPELVARRDRERAPRLKWAAYTSSRFLTGVVTGLAAQATLALVPSVFGGLIAATFVGALVSELLDIGFTLVTASVRGGSVVEMT